MSTLLSVEDITTASSFDISRMGIGLCPQGRRVFPTLSVRENLLVAQQEHDVGYRWDFKEVYELFPRLGERAGQRAGSLSGGEQQMLAVGRALMTNPSCLIMDEPSEGLAPMIIQDIGNAIQSLKAEGLAVVLVEQNAAFAVKTVDRVCVITNGKVVYESSPQELWADEEVRKTHLGIG